LYSQMAGVLAAFAFGAITLVLPVEAKRRGSRSEPLVLLALTAAFVGLLIATLQYAVLAGERGCGLLLGRAASEEFLGGVAFAFSVLLLMYAIVQLIAGFRVPGLSFHARLIIVTLGAPLAMLFLSTGAVDVAATPWEPKDGIGVPLPRTTALQSALASSSIFVTLGLAAACLLAWLAGRKFRKSAMHGVRSGRPLRRSRTAFPYVSLLLAVCAVARSVSLDVLRPRDRITDFEVVLWLAVCLVVLFWQAVLLSFERGTDRPSVESINSPGGPGAAVRPKAGKKLTGLLAGRQHLSHASDELQETLEPLTKEVLVKRSLETFPAGYLNHISIIQGVALGLLVQQLFAFLNDGNKNFAEQAEVIGEAFFLFGCIVVVSYEYIWFLTIMRWIPGFLDTLVPLSLGLSEVVPIFLMGKPVAWMGFVAAFVLMGAAAFRHTLSNLDPRLFADAHGTQLMVRRLLRQLVGFCLAMSALIMAGGALVLSGVGWLRWAFPWMLSVVPPVMVAVNELALDRIYENFGLRRRVGRLLRRRPSPDGAGT
jgi:hypothetical protein